MARRRAPCFAAPLLVTFALGAGTACKKDQAAPPPAKRAVDARVTAPVPIDASRAELPIDAEPAIGELVFEDPECYRAGADGKRDYVDCPETSLPAPPTDQLVLQVGPSCIVVGRPTGPYRRVRCPDGGPTVAMPDPSMVQQGNDQIHLRDGALTCYLSKDVACPPDVDCNPPPPQPVECPRGLLPRLQNGATPTATKDGKCFWQAVEVSCP